MRKAFTLIELLVVISIIALLIAILLPVLGSSLESSRRLECSANGRSVFQGYHILATDNRGTYRLMARSLGGANERSLTFASNARAYEGVGQHHITQMNRHVYADMLDAGITLNNFRCPNRDIGFIRASNDSQADLINPKGGTASHFRIAFYSMIGNDQSRINLASHPDSRLWVSPRLIDDAPDLPAVACILERGTINGPWIYPHGPRGPVENASRNPFPEDTESNGGNVAFNDGSSQFVPTDSTGKFAAFLGAGNLIGHWPDVDSYDDVNP